MHQNLGAQLVTSLGTLVKVQRCRAMAVTDYQSATGPEDAGDLKEVSSDVH